MKKLALLMMLFVLGLCVNSCKEEEKSIPIDNTEEKESPKEEEKEPEKIFPYVIPEKRLKWQGSIEDNFKEDEVLVVVANRYSNKEYKVEDFSAIEIEKLELITKKTWIDFRNQYIPYSYNLTDSDFVDSNRLVYRLTLKDKGKEQVMEAIRKLEELEFIRLAIPNLSTEGKQPIEEKEKWIRRINEEIQVFDYFLIVEMDEQYKQNFFLPEDFEGVDVKGIYFDIIGSEHMEEYIRMGKFCIIFEDDGTPAEEHIKELEKLEFIKSVYPYQCYKNSHKDCDFIEIYKKSNYFDKVYTIEDFPDLELKEVEDEGIRIMLTLKNPGMKNIYSVIEYLERNKEKYEFIGYTRHYHVESSADCLDDEITITLKEEYQDKELTIEDFPNVKMERIFKQKNGSYKIILYDKGCSNIAVVVQVLKEYEFIEKITFSEHFHLD